MAPEEVVKAECWVATEGELGSLHVENGPLYYTVLCLWEKGLAQYMTLYNQKL